MRILTVTTLYPNAEVPAHGVFVENRLRHLLKAGQLEGTVVAPVPWFPFGSKAFGRYAQMARVPIAETRNGLHVTHPRFLVLPKLGMSAAPFLLYMSLERHVRSALESGKEFDLIDAHYVYPDGVAAAWLGAALDKPVVITARGTDLTLIPKYAIPRVLIQRALRHCSAVVAVSQPLAELARVLAGPKIRIEMLRNGVDLNVFHEKDRLRVRHDLGLNGPTIISVGHLIPRKGHECVIEAISLLPDAQLLICGEGPMRADLVRKARKCGVADRVLFLGRIKHEDLNRYYSGADVLVLASWREGWPNVLLEAMACGTPVVATAVGAAPQFVRLPGGIIIEDRKATTIASAIEELLRSSPSRKHVKEYAAQFSWDDTTERLLDLFAEAIHNHKVRAI